MNWKIPLFFLTVLGSAHAAVDAECQRACEATRGARCATACDLPAPPTEAELERIARDIAIAETRQRLSLVHVQDYLDPAGKARTRAYVWGPHGVVLDAELSEDPRYSAGFFTVEVGLRPDLPPVVGFTRGLPIDVRARRDAELHLRRAFRSRSLRPVAVYGYAIRPVLAYESDDGPALIDLTTFLVARTPPTARPDRGRTATRTHELNPSWTATLAAVREGGR